MTDFYDDIFSSLDDLADLNLSEGMLHGHDREPARKVLILGGGGFLGTALCRLLVDAGHQVTVLDQFIYNSSTLDNFSGNSRLRVINGDVRNQDLLEELMRENEMVVNLAAVVGDEEL